MLKVLAILVLFSPLSVLAQDSFVDLKEKAEGGDLQAQTELGEQYLKGPGVAHSQPEAIAWFRRAAEKGYAPAQRRLGELLVYENGMGFLSKPNIEGLAWLTKAAEQGDVESQFTLGNLYSIAPSFAAANKAMSQFGASGATKLAAGGLPNDSTQAIFWYEKAAEQGHVKSQLKLASFYSLGTIVPKDQQRAIHWTRKAAEQGDPAGQMSLGTIYGYGQGVSKDKEQARFWLNKVVERGGFAGALAKKQIEGIESEDAPLKPAPPDLAALRLKAEGGDAHTQFILGNLYGDDKSVLKDEAEATKWIKKAADQQFPAAERNLADRYFMGIGVLRDAEQFRLWLRRAADHGDADSQMYLSNLYSLGMSGFPKDPAQTLFWLRRGAEQGDVQCQAKLASTYQLGLIVPKDEAEALKWLKRAAEQGDTGSQFLLGRQYEMGEGVPKDTAKAIAWYQRAADQDPINLMQGVAANSLKRLKEAATTNP